MISIEKANPIPASTPGPDVQTEIKDEAEWIQRSLQKLSDDKREVLLLSRFQNMKYEEIARITGCAVGTIKARVHHALKELSVIYKDLSGESAS